MVEGSLNKNALKMTIGRSGLIQGYLISAKGLFSGLEVLTKTNESHLACAFLAGQTLERIFKCYLAYSGYEEIQLKKISHDLKKIWKKAAKRDLDIPSEFPEWCKTLNAGYNYPFLFRYPKGIDAFVFPVLEEMTEEIRKLIDKVGKIVK